MKYKICTRCKIRKPLNRKYFFVETNNKLGFQTCCKLCHQWYVNRSIRRKPDKYKEIFTRSNKNRTKEQQRMDDRRKREKDLQKIRTRYLSWRMLQRGEIKRENCLVCGSTDSEIHHLDYNTPDNIVWLCSYHHKRRHLLKKHIEHEKYLAMNNLNT